jgi:hypothetical protein
LIKSLLPTYQGILAIEVTMTASNNNFRIAYNALRLQAVAHGLDPLDSSLNQFLIHVAEVEATNHELLRKAENLNHLTGDSTHE